MKVFQGLTVCQADATLPAFTSATGLSGANANGAPDVGAFTAKLGGGTNLDGCYTNWIPSGSASDSFQLTCLQTSPSPTASPTISPTYYVPLCTGAQVRYWTDTTSCATATQVWCPPLRLLSLEVPLCGAVVCS